jgi:hypothetical protein
LSPANTIVLIFISVRSPCKETLWGDVIDALFDQGPDDISPFLFNSPDVCGR